MITSFADKETAKVFLGEFSKKLPADVQRNGQQKLVIIDQTLDIIDLWKHPGLKVEKLSGKRNGQWSIRINRQWRICFGWLESTPEASAVEICDYH